MIVLVIVDDADPTIRSENEQRRNFEVAAPKKKKVAKSKLSPLPLFSRRAGMNATKRGLCFHLHSMIRRIFHDKVVDQQKEIVYLHKSRSHKKESGIFKHYFELLFVNN